MIRDAWRLAVGTLTAIPVRPPGTVDRRTAALAMLCSPLAVVPLAAGVTLALGLSGSVPLDPHVGGVVAVAVLALGTRAMHLDGLADTCDGLAASYDRERSLAVMKSGTSGPAGVTAIVIALALQAMAFAGLAGDWRTAAVAGASVCFSRVCLAWCCSPLVGAARPDGLGRTFAGSVPIWAAGATTVVLGAVMVALAHRAGMQLWRPLASIAVAGVTLGLLLQRVRRRLGGITGDVLGAAIECCLAATLILLAL